MKKLLLLLLFVLTSCSTDSVQLYHYWRATYNSQMLITNTNEITKEVYDKHQPEKVYFEDGFNREYFKTID